MNVGDKVYLDDMDGYEIMGVTEGGDMIVDNTASGVPRHNPEIVTESRLRLDEHPRRPPRFR